MRNVELSKSSSNFVKENWQLDKLFEYAHMFNPRIFKKDFLFKK